MRNRKYHPRKVSKERQSLEYGRKVAEEILATFSPYCTRIQCAGSIRRCKPTVADVEFVIIPKFEEKTIDLFPEMVNITFAWVDHLIAQGYLQKRLKIDGSASYGDKIRLLVHTATGFPVDLFFTTEQCWYNLLVCRTGGKDLNTLIARRALQQGARWNMGGSGFIKQGVEYPMHSEEEVFEYIGIPYIPPEERF